MTISEYLRSLTNVELIEQYRWFNQDEDDGWFTTLAACVTPYGAITKHMVDKEMERRASNPETV